MELLMRIFILLALQSLSSVKGYSKIDSSESECGLSKKRMARVASGQPVRPGDHPWIAALYLIQENKVFCGGSLISQKHVLTAAHCFNQGKEAHEFFVRLGEVDLRRKDESKSIDMKVAHYTIHDKYDRDVLGNFDIALITMKNDVNYNRYIRPICLPTLNEPTYRINQTAYAAGWGLTFFWGEMSQILRDVDLQILSPSKCDGIKKELTENEICAGDYNEKKDTCSGDSGGPLIALRKDMRWVLLGITSWGSESCGQRTRFGVYARVDHFLDWINDTMIINDVDYQYYQSNYYD